MLKVCLSERKTWWWSGSWYWKWLSTITQLCLYLFTSEHSWQWFSIMRPSWEGFQFRKFCGLLTSRPWFERIPHVWEREKLASRAVGAPRRPQLYPGWDRANVLLGKQAQIVTIHEETWASGWLNLISCWLSSFAIFYPVLSLNGLVLMDFLMLFPSSLAFTGLDKWE